MKRFLTVLLSLALMLSACSFAYAEGEEETVTIVDHTDREVNVPKDCKRIVVCDILPLPSVLTVFFNSAERIVGMSEPSMTAAANSLLGQLYPEILNAETGFINGSDVNVEELMKLEPDVVFYSASNPSLGDQLTKAGFVAVGVSASKWDYDCIETLNQWIALLGEIFPENEKTYVVREYSEKVYNMIQERVSTLNDDQRARAFFLFKYNDSMITTAGQHFFGQWWADAVGAINVATELQQDNAVTVNMEQVYAWNPDLIFITNFTTATADDLAGNTIGNYDWSGITAVESGRVYKMPLGLYRSYTPGADTPMTLLWMAKTTYPDMFEDIDITAEVKEYYKTTFDVDLTDEQVESIFAPTADAAGGFNS